MRASGKIKRYFRIIDIIQESPHPTSKKVLDSLYNDGFDISERTLQRSLKDLRNEFFINVQFNRSRGAYEWMESEEEYVQQLLKFFKLSYQAETLSSSLGQSKKLSEHVSYDYNKRYGVHSAYSSRDTKKNLVKNQPSKLLYKQNEGTYY